MEQLKKPDLNTIPDMSGDHWATVGTSQTFKWDINTFLAMFVFKIFYWTMRYFYVRVRDTHSLHIRFWGTSVFTVVYGCASMFNFALQKGIWNTFFTVLFMFLMFIALRK